MRLADIAGVKPRHVGRADLCEESIVQCPASLRKDCPVRPGRGRSVQGRPPWHCLVPCVLACAAGCHDSRLNYDEFMARRSTAAAAASQPVKVEPVTQLNIPDYRRYKIQNGDVLQLTLTGVAERYQPTVIRARVSDQGDVALPLVGNVRVGGLEFASAEAAILSAHKQLITEPFSVFVELVGPENTTVVVSGAATYPGLISLPQNERSVLAALSRAGAFGVTSSGIIQYKPINPKRQPATFDLTDINDVRKILLMPPVESGDTLVVEAADSSVVFVTGLLNGPGGSIPVPRNGSMSLIKAVSAAGGTRELIDVKEATLFRRLADGEQVRVKVPLGDIWEGKAPDLALVAGDVLQIPHTLDTRFQDWVNNNVLRSFTIGVHYDPLQQYNTNRLIRTQDGNNNIGNSLLLNLSNLLIPTTPPGAVTP